MKDFVLGLDIGVRSVGYDGIDLDRDEIVDYGVHLFKERSAVENVNKCESRSSILSRSRILLSDMKIVLKKYHIMHEYYQPLSNVYEIRCKGLTQKLTDDELTAAILHITKHRGSVIETVEKDAEKGAKLGLANNEQEMQQGKYICELQWERLLNKHKVRGHANHFFIKDYVSEVNEILEHQDVSAEAKQEILSLVQGRQAYYKGTGRDKSLTPYGCVIEANGLIEKIDLIEKMRGKCSVFPDEFCAPKMSVSADLFNFLNDLNNLTVKDEKLTIDEKEQVLAIISKKGNVTLKQLSKLLEVDVKDIKGYRNNKHEKTLFTEFKGYMILKRLFEDDGYLISLSDFEILDEVIEILTKKKGIEERKQALKQCRIDLSDTLLHILANSTDFVGYHSLSLKALRIMNKELFELS